jgi:hypothetical protein
VLDDYHGKLGGVLDIAILLAAVERSGMNPAFLF